MESNLKKTKKTRNSIVVALLIFLIAATTLTVPLTLITVNAQSTAATNLLQYEVKNTGTNWNNLYDGPAPNQFNIQWMSSINASQLSSFNNMVAFNGKLFVSGALNTFAVAPSTGEILWTANVSGGLTGVDDTHLLVGSSLIDVKTGNVLWTATNGFVGNIFGDFTTGAIYVSEEKMYYVRSGASVMAWDLSDLSRQPNLVWTKALEFSGFGMDYGDGKLFPSPALGYQIALDAKTGTLLWRTNMQEQGIYGAVYYNGVLVRGGAGNTVYAFNGTTGQILWKYNPGTYWGFWSSDAAAAYGKYYELNTDGNLYAIDIITGQLVWKFKGAGNFYPGHPIVADGKVYMETGNTFYQDPLTGASGQPQYVCLNAETGKLIWQAAMQVRDPFTQHIIAYGNIYAIATVYPGSPQPPMFNPDIPTDANTYSLTPYAKLICIGGASATQDWSMYRGGPSQTANGTSGPTNIVLKWNFTTGGMVISSPSVVNGVVYVGSQDMNIYALNSNTGSKIWNFTIGYLVRSSPAVANGKVYTGADDGNVYCLEAATGQQLWKSYAGGLLPDAKLPFANTYTGRSSPIVVNNRVYVGSLDNNTYCFDANSGSLLWTFATNGPIMSAPTVTDGALYITSNTPNPVRTLYKLDATSGTLVWKFELKTSVNSTNTAEMSSPTVAAGLVFIGFKGSGNAFPDPYYALNATTGAIVWNYMTHGAGEPVMGSILYANGRLYFSDKFNMVCINATTTEVLWKLWVGRSIYDSAVYAAGKIYFGTEEGTFHVVDAASGTKLSYYHTGVDWWSSAALYDGKVYIGSLNNNVYCFEEDANSATTYYGLPVTHSASPNPTVEPTIAPASTLAPTSTAKPTVAPTQSPSAAPTATLNPSPSATPQTETNSTNMYLIAGIVVIVVAVAIAAAVVLLRKRK